jgi:endo-alpha-1,4-polygalactosaminidase (GH114 family)
MLDYDMPEFIKEIQKEIPEEDIYYGEKGEDKKTTMFGIEHESHITIVYGLDNKVKFSEIEPYLFPLKEYQTILVNISTFENEKFDVLKVTAKCPKASESNKLIMDNFDVHTDYKDFNPHMTIAYMKKGKSEKYKKYILDKIDTIKPYRFNYSYADDGKDKNVYIKRLN